MASKSGAPVPPAAAFKISGAFLSPGLTSNRELLSLRRSLEHPAPSKTTGSDPRNHVAIIHICSTLIYCLIQAYAISRLILFTALVYVLDYFYKSKLNNPPCSQDLDVEHSSHKIEPREAADPPPRDPQHLNDRPDDLMSEDIGPPWEIETMMIDESEDDTERATCSLRVDDGELDRGHVEAGCVEDIEISDSENDSDHDYFSLGEADGNVNDQESESQEDEPLQGVEENSKQLNPPQADECDTVTGSEAARTPISITGREELVSTGETLLGSRSATNTLLPDFNDEFPAPEHKEKRRPHEPPEEVPASEIPKMCSFYNDLGWVSRGTPKKRNNWALAKKIELPLSGPENRRGVLYIRKHDHYNNLYKIGVTTAAMEKRQASHPLCIKTNTSESYATDRFVGALRAESLAKIHMTSRNVPLKVCLLCRIGKQAKSSAASQIESARQSKTHTEYFTGDFDDIKACVDFWAETVARVYDEDTAAFTGNLDDTLGTVLSSEGKRRKSRRQESAESRGQHLDSPTPCPRRTDAERRPITGSAGPEGDDETDLPDGVRLGDRRQLWERRDDTVANVGVTPKEKAARGSSCGGRGVGPEGPRTRSKTQKLRELSAVLVSLDGASRVVE